VFHFRKTPPAAPPPVSAEGALYGVIDRTQAMIRFLPDGTILDANANFLAVMGYRREEIVGRHHAIFVRPEDAVSPAYKTFWSDLAQGRFTTAQFPRLAKGGGLVWIHATYAPVFDADNRVTEVIKVATDITPRQTGIEALARGLAELSEGNLTHRVPPAGDPDIDKLVTSFNGTADRMASVLAAVTSTSESVDRTARELGTASTDLSARTEVQAATLEQTAAAIRELTESATATSDNALGVERLAQTVRQKAEGGGKVATEAIGAMSRIAESSQRIAEVISVIHEIAFQTNLLALNARVEAARAGEAGRGFAVVASEVRDLAVRSAEAAAEIRNLTRQSQDHVTEGVDLVTRAGEELEEIVGGIKGIHDKISGIANGAREQSATLQEINTGVSQLDLTTQQNAVMVDQSAAAARSLLAETEVLFRQVAIFRLDSTASRRAAAPRLTSAA